MLAVIEKSFPQVLEDQGRHWHLLDLCPALHFFRYLFLYVLRALRHNNYMYLYTRRYYLLIPNIYLFIQML